MRIVRFYSTLFILFAAISSYAQDFPENPEPGKCYIKCVIPDVWGSEDVKVLVKDASTKISSTPAVYKTVTEKKLATAASKKVVTTAAKYKTVTEKLLIKEASTKLIAVSATFKTVSEKVVAVEASTKIITKSAVYKTETERIMISPEKTKWVQSKTPGCLSPNPNDCLVWCLKPVRAQYKTVTKRMLKTPASSSTIQIPTTYKTITKKIIDKQPYTKEVNISAQYKTITKRVLVTPASTKSIDIPETYKTITKRVLVTPASSSTINIPAEYKTIQKKVLVKKGGHTVFKEVVCGTKVSGDKIAAYNISDIQNGLISKGYNLGDEGANNEFNEATRKAFVQFQRSRGYKVGGFDKTTLRALGIKI